jgi:hypothetical protein
VRSYCRCDSATASIAAAVMSAPCPAAARWQSCQGMRAAMPLGNTNCFNQHHMLLATSSHAHQLPLPILWPCTAALQTQELVRRGATKDILVDVGMPAMHRGTAVEVILIMTSCVAYFPVCQAAFMPTCLTMYSSDSLQLYIQHVHALTCKHAARGAVQLPCAAAGRESAAHSTQASFGK